jgi:hypothetical protein
LLAHLRLGMGRYGPRIRARFWQASYVFAARAKSAGIQYKVLIMKDIFFQTVLGWRV